MWTQADAPSSHAQICVRLSARGQNSRRCVCQSVSPGFIYEQAAALSETQRMLAAVSGSAGQRRWAPAKPGTGMGPGCRASGRGDLGLRSQNFGSRCHRRWGWVSLPWHLRRDWAHPCHICAGKGLYPLPHLIREWAHPCHICARTGLPASAVDGDRSAGHGAYD
jgi:hypothetical protein